MREKKSEFHPQQKEDCTVLVHFTNIPFLLYLFKFRIAGKSLRHFDEHFASIVSERSLRQPFAQRAVTAVVGMRRE